ncbi:hypothetical protein ACFPA8_27620 [Streptomyces ovatisporus]|uniref:Uncharacterized protein n=1 Tax=Streptomyces ovatisporus TaxID=1128682 RepID=A0ABV9ADC9_9ACTN
MNQALRTRQNEAAHWNARQSAAKTNDDLVAIMYDRCRSIVKKRRKSAANEEEKKAADALAFSLAQALDAWQRDHG